MDQGPALCGEFRNAKHKSGHRTLTIPVYSKLSSRGYSRATATM
jgi:hypothetical protein